MESMRAALLDPFVLSSVFLFSLPVSENTLSVGPGK